MARVEREQRIWKWLECVERSKLSAPAFFAKYRVPFSLAQFYRYRKALQEQGSARLTDGRSLGNNRRVPAEVEGFLVGYVCAHPQAPPSELRSVMGQRLGIEISQPGLHQCLKRLGISRPRSGQPALPLGAPTACKRHSAGGKIGAA